MSVSAPSVATTLPASVARELGRLVDEDRSQIRGASHAGARPFRENEPERILGATS